MLENDLLLLSGEDIPFASARINIHQPTIREISYIGEEVFHVGSRFLLFNKDILEDKNGLENTSDFNIFMAIMNNNQMLKHKTNALMVLTLMFPNVRFKIDKDKILLQQENIEVESSITELNFEEFQNIVRQMFCLGGTESGEESYNPADAFAKKIAERFKKRQEQLAKHKGEKGQKINLFLRYISILAVGLQKDINELLDYTVYQLFDEFKRYQMKQDFDIYVQAKMAGAKDLEEVKNWMEDIHS